MSRSTFKVVHLPSIPSKLGNSWVGLKKGTQQKLCCLIITFQMSIYPPVNYCSNGQPHFSRERVERRILLKVGFCYIHLQTSSHLLIFLSSHLFIFTPSHLLIFTPSHLLIFTPSHLHIFSSSLLHIFSSSHLLIFSSSPLLIFTSSHLLIFTSSHFHTFLTFTSSHLHIFTSSPSCPLALFSLLLFYFSLKARGSANEAPRNATLSHKMRFDRQKLKRIAIFKCQAQPFRTKWGSIVKSWKRLRFTSVGRNPFAQNEVR